MKSTKVVVAQFATLLLVWTCQSLAGTQPGTRAIPVPLAEHPGNIFLAGEAVSIAAPTTAGRWQLVDYDEKVHTEVDVKNGRLELGTLPVGFFRLKNLVATNANWISVGVLQPLKAPTPPTSPVAIDVAMSWFYPPDKMPAAANLCALAGVNWVRDRLSWGEMESRKGQFASSNRYDAAAAAQSRAGLQVLQVNHSSAAWANPKGKRFPLDLRDAYAFYREMARRWQGQVTAFEPWNEADITMFGGHTGSEMASMQKASWLGLKAGNPNVIVCWNVFAMHNKAQLEDVQENEAWPYFDTFNLHHYAPFKEYPGLYADFRAISAGKPLWVTECSVPVKWAGDQKLKEPTDTDLRLQAERVAPTFACSLHEGSSETFYFLLPHYVEGQTQFGILRPDLTPRPSYLALSAVGRLLADAKPVGKWKSGHDSVNGYWFNAKPDGESSDVLVVWSGAGEVDVTLPGKPHMLFDHLGRQKSLAGQRLPVAPAPQIVLFKPGASTSTSLVQLPPRPTLLTGRPSPVVFQALMPPDSVVLKDSAYRVGPGETTLTVNCYNFATEPVSGALHIEAPEGWAAAIPAKIEVGATEKKALQVTVGLAPAANGASAPGESRPSGSKPAGICNLRIVGDFGPAGKPVLALRLKPEVR